MKNNDEKHQSGACPTFFRGCVARARGSQAGYSDPGYHLAIHARELAADDVPDKVIDELDRALAAADAAEQIWQWLRRTLPRCMALVPRRRKPTFLKGIAAAIEDGRV